MGFSNLAEYDQTFFGSEMRLHHRFVFLVTDFNLSHLLQQTDFCFRLDLIVAEFGRSLLVLQTELCHRLAFVISKPANRLLDHQAERHHCLASLFVESGRCNLVNETEFRDRLAFSVSEFGPRLFILKRKCLLVCSFFWRVIRSTPARCLSPRWSSDGSMAICSVTNSPGRSVSSRLRTI